MGSPDERLKCPAISPLTNLFRQSTSLDLLFGKLSALFSKTKILREAVHGEQRKYIKTTSQSVSASEKFQFFPKEVVEKLSLGVRRPDQVPVSSGDAAATNRCQQKYWRENACWASQAATALLATMPAQYSPLHAGLRSTFQRHRLRFIIAFVVASFLFLFVLGPSNALKSITKPGYTQIYKETTSQPKVPPPPYEGLRKWEQNLPQHNTSLPYPEGKNGRYVLFSNQIKMLGWNNVLNEVLMNAHLAHASKRAYVFQDYVWKPAYYPWPENQRLQNPPHTPLGALIAGPTVGEPWGEGDESPRSVSEAYYNQVCPKYKRRLFKTGDIKPILAWKEGIEIFEYWAKALGEAEDSCVEVVASGEDNFPQTFDLWLFGAERIISLWDNFRQSATSKLLRTSPVVAAAVSRNEYLFTPRGPRPPIPVSPNPYDRMLSMHIRRGDFKGACIHLMTWNSTFYSWNQLPELPDPLIFPKDHAWNTTEYNDAIMERCLPEADVIVKKARESRDDYVRASKGKKRTLDILYLLTNEKGEWLAKMKEELIKDGWHTIVTSNDLELDSEGVDTGMAIDMEIARLAAVFIGNGWSSFTSNIVHRRLVDGKEPISTRFF